MSRLYRPSLRAFGGSLLWALSPIGLALFVIWLAGNHLNRLGWGASILMGLFSVLMVLQAIWVFSLRVDINERSFEVRGPFARNGIAWRNVKTAVLRERVNRYSRTDHLLILTGDAGPVSFNTSTLSPADERSLLEQVRLFVDVLVERDKPSL